MKPLCFSVQQQQITVPALEMAPRRTRLVRIEACVAGTAASRRELPLDWHLAATSR